MKFKLNQINYNVFEKWSEIKFFYVEEGKIQKNETNDFQ